MCHPNVSLKQPMRFAAEDTPTTSLLQRSISEACDDSLASSSANPTQHCACEYHSPFHFPSEPAEDTGGGCRSLLDILKEITPEACEALQKRKRSREESDDEKEEEDNPSTPSSRLVEQLEETDEIAAVMGFGTFSSSKKFPPESSH
jgi:hypothetical protein